MKKILFIFWILLISFSLYRLFTIGISLSEYPQFIANKVDSFGIWAPVLFISLFAIRPLIFFPATILSLSAGALFGPITAVFILIIAENISSLISFTMGKFFGKNIIASLDKKSVFLHKFEKYLHQNGFISVLMLRLFYAPFDLVGYFSGASNIAYRDFALATFIGILPGLITAAFLGGSIYTPVNLLISGFFFILGLVISKFIKNNCNYVTTNN